MAIVRDIGITLPAMQQTILVTCGASISTGAASTAPTQYGALTTGDSIISTGGPLVVGGTSTVYGIGWGRVIDRLTAPLGAGYGAAMPSAYIHSTRGCTDADRRIQLGVALQHGDSSGGGDMAELSTQDRPDIRTYFSSARTSDQANWETSGRSTGPLYAVSNPAVYDLNGAKRYLRVVVFAGKDNVTTSAYGDEGARIGANITFMAADSLPQLYTIERNSPESSTTTT